MTVTKKTALKLPVPRMKSAEYMRQCHRVTPEAGTPYDAVTEPSYWAHVAQKINPYDKIEVVAEDGAWYAELLVLSVDKMAITVREIVLIDLHGDSTEDAEGDQEQSDYFSKYRGPHLQWCVMRRSDQACVRDKIQTKVQAQQEALDLGNSRVAA